MVRASATDCEAYALTIDRGCEVADLSDPCKTLIEESLFVVTQFGHLLVLSRGNAANDRMAASCFCLSYVALAKDNLGSFSGCLDELLM